MTEKAYRGERAAEEQSTSDLHMAASFHHSVEEGEARTRRRPHKLIATGLMGGVDVSVGLLAMLVAKELTGSTAIGALAFSVGFLVLVFSHSELFTENFLHPVTAWAVNAVSSLSVLRLWGATLVFNLIGGWLFSWLIVWGVPSVHGTAIDIGIQFVQKSNVELIALGILGGMAITLLTWIEESAKTSDFGKGAITIGIAFLFIAAHLNHSIIVSLEMFVGLNTGMAPYGYDDWARVAGIALVTNVLGGVGLVTGLRLLQAGREGIEHERSRERLHLVSARPIGE